MEYMETRPDKGVPAVALKGDWTVMNAADIEKVLAAGPVRENSPLEVDAGNIEKLDTVGAWLIRKHFPGAHMLHLSENKRALLDFVPQEQEQPAVKPVSAVSLVDLFIKVGETAFWSFDFVYAVLAMVGSAFVRFARNFARPARFRPASIVRHAYETGVRALPIICLLAFGVSMVISYQGAMQLRRFGADIYTIDLTVISLLREMAVLTTAIMVAGRSGSAFAAEIGVMKTRNEVDALQTIGLDPIETLVLPRLLALLITLPALSFIADIVGLAGGGVMSVAQLGISMTQYISRVETVINPTMFFVGMIKAPVFGFLITAVCVYQGLSATGSAENVGKLTTLAVVQSIFLVMMADALFSIAFAKVGI